jgi:hypothetical protein
MSIPIFDYREHRLPSGLIIPMSTMSHPEPFRSKQIVVTAEANGVQSKIFSVFFLRELGYFVHLGYFSPCHALAGRYVNTASPGGSATIDMTAGGKISVLGFKFTQHASGQAHFSLTRKMPPQVQTMTTPPSRKLGHAFTVNFAGIESFARAGQPDKKPPSRERTVLNFHFDDPHSPPGKIIAWWYPIRAMQIAELGEGNPWEPKPAHMRTQDGRMLSGFFVAPPMDWDWNDHGLLLTVDPMRRPDSSLDSFLLLQGGVAIERDNAGNDMGESFIAAMFTDRSDELERMTEELGTLDNSEAPA